MAQPFTRPENRQRSGSGDVEWPDTVPNRSRSEGFAEDLAAWESADADVAPAPSRSAAALPSLGLALAAMFGVLAR